MPDEEWRRRRDLGYICGEATAQQFGRSLTRTAVAKLFWRKCQIHVLNHDTIRYEMLLLRERESRRESA